MLKGPLLITFEGIDGSGKSTQARLLHEYFKSLGFDSSLYREPGSTAIGEKLRKVILDHTLDPFTELMLFETARSVLMKEVVIPELEKGKIVILDRFIDSTVAYQGYGKGMDIEFIKELNNRATQGYKPNITFLLDVPVEIAMERVRKRENQEQRKTRFEQENFLNKVREGFLEIADQEKDRVVVIDGRGSTEEVFQKVRQSLVIKKKKFNSKIL